MKLKRIYAENYKTYRRLDLDLTVSDDKPIILVGGANGCGKTTLFDAIYGALYGLEIRDGNMFTELFNAGAKNELGVDKQAIVLEVTFSGVVLNRETPYRLKRSYVLVDGAVRESVELNMDGNCFVYGSAMAASQRAANEELVNKIIAANLPRELSNYFLFDAMKTSELVKEEQISKLIMKNINSVMGFNKYIQLKAVSETLLAEKKAARLENEAQRSEYEDLLRSKQDAERSLQSMRDDYTKALSYASENREAYNRVLAGRNGDDVVRDKIEHIKKSFSDFSKKETEYKQEADSLAREFEMNVIFPKLADVLRPEIEVILHEKERVNSEDAAKMTSEQVENVTHELVEYISEHYITMQKIDEGEVSRFLLSRMNDKGSRQDKFPYLTTNDVSVLSQLVKSAYSNPFLSLDDKRISLNMEIQSIPQRQAQLDEYIMTLRGTDYSLIDVYEQNEKRIGELKGKIAQADRDIEQLKKRISSYDYDIPQIPDPQYDMLCKLPDFFRTVSQKLLAVKKSNIERMMCEQLNVFLLIYSGCIGRVELSGRSSEDVSFKIYHSEGNEIYLSQLNAGAKQTVMQVLLKVLYELGDYDPPVMIDTVMGVLDKESREVILEKYFPDLAHQTILFSTNTEITTERDFQKIEAFVSKAYTLHRNKEGQFTTIQNDYFGLTPNN